MIENLASRWSQAQGSGTPGLADPRIKTALQNDEGYLSQIPFPLHLCARCFRVFQKIPCLCSNCPCPSQSKLFALTTDLLGTADGHPNMVQAIIRSLASWRIKTLSGWYKVIEVWGVLLVRTLADTRRHSSNLAISWCSCLSLQIRWNTGHSCIAFRKGVTMLQPQCSYLRWTYQSPNNEATASSHRNGKTQPTQRLGCTKGDLTLSFPCAIPLWSSTEQWNCELVSQESQQHRNPSLITGKQMIRCRFQVALGGWSSFSKPWHWNALNLVPFSQSLPGDQQSCARKPEQNQLPSATYRTIFN